MAENVTEKQEPLSEHVRMMEEMVFGFRSESAATQSKTFPFLVSFMLFPHLKKKKKSSSFPQIQTEQRFTVGT